MKKLLFLLSFIALSLCFTSVDVSAQKRAYDIHINSDQDPDTSHIMVSETATTKYRYGRYKSINLVRQRNLVTGYKEYEGFVTQTGTAAPSSTVLTNTLGGTLVWTYTGVGIYTGTLVGAFPVAKTVAACGFIDCSTGDATYSLKRSSDDAVLLKTYSDTDSTAANAVLIATPIRFRVYN